MGCVSSKLFKNEFHQEAIFSNGDYKNHVVSLTSSTYGLLKLDSEPMKELIRETKLSPPKVVLPPKFEEKVLDEPKKVVDEPEIINTWELMKGLDEAIRGSTPAKKSPKSQVFSPNPSKFFNQINSPKKVKKFSGKENTPRQNGLDSGGRKSEPSPQNVLKPLNSLEKVQRIVPSLKYPLRSTPVSLKTENLRYESRVSTSSRRSLSPLFDPELLASIEKELNEHGEQIKKMVSPKPRRTKSQDSESILQLYEKKCPPGGQIAVVIYTTTLRGIRKTFEDCNVVRSLIGSHHIHVIERDISMDSGYREELRVLLGKKEVRVPLVFVKGRLIGGADEIVKMEEEGKLGILFDGIARSAGGCEGCAGVRFVMCMDCSGSCKILDEEQKKMVKCGECNENGLIHCPICC